MKFSCPRCGDKSRAVKAITLLSLLNEADKAWDIFEGFRFCPSSSCDILYFQPETNKIYGADSVAVEVFQKSTSPARPVCYCFGYCVSKVRREAALRDGWQIVQSITEKCRQGEGRCDEKNPQGSCCLGNVRALIRQTQAKQGRLKAGEEDTPASSCCGTVCE